MADKKESPMVDSDIEEKIIEDNEVNEDNMEAAKNRKSRSDSDMAEYKTEKPLKKDRTLREILPLINEYAPIIPDAVLDYYFTSSGFDCDDVRMYVYKYAKGSD